MFQIASPRALGGMLVALLLVGGAGCGVLMHRAERTLDGVLDVPVGVRIAAADFAHGDMRVDGADGSSLSLHADVTVSAASQQIADEVAAALRISFPLDGDLLRVVVAPLEDHWPVDSYTLAVTSHLVVPRGIGLDLSTTHGDLSLANLSGDVSASTTHGDLVARGLEAQFALVTTHGDVDVELGERAGGRSSVTTTHGDVTCRFAKRVCWDVDASTSHDLVRSEWPGLESRDEGRSGTLHVGGAEAAGRLEIRTTHGEVLLAVAGEQEDERN